MWDMEFGSSANYKNASTLLGIQRSYNTISPSDHSAGSEWGRMPMNDATVFVQMAEIIRHVKVLEGFGQTGSLYLMTPAGDGGVFVLDGGVVVDVVYKSVQGTGALPMLRRIAEAKYFFKSGQTDEVKAAAAKTSTLSYGQTLFRMFERALVDAPPVARAVNQPSPAPVVAAPLAKKKVLVVEDSRVARIVLCKFLQDHGYHVIEAANGRSALSQLAVDAPDLVILDLILPDIDGYEIFHSMKDDARTRDIPVIILTSRGSLVDKLRGRMSGSDEYVTKPFKNEILLEKLKKYLQ
jgi:CheY-like chemotaxis protein